MSTAAVIVAAGSGSRAGGDLPKQYQLIGGKAVLWWTIKAFLDHPGITAVQVVIGPGQEALYAAAVEGLSLLPAIVGGSTRQESCRLGLEALNAAAPLKVLIHDGARPFASQDLISHVIAHLERFRGVIPAMPLSDTLKLAPGGIIARTIPRDSMWAAQTPQGFRFPDILAAHRAAFTSGSTTLTDDASVAEHAGLEVAIIPGRVENKKLTLADDISEADRKLTARALAELPDVRMGQGIDFHIFEAGEHVMLCGVSIPHNQKLKGHSDADAALHALTDAILGAIGEGDIGTHFPPTDPKWKGAASRIFVEKAMALLAARKGRLSNVDLTILAEAPKISPYIAAMKTALAGLLALSPDRIAIKATTTEKMGALGRREGLAAFAIATVRLP